MHLEPLRGPCGEVIGCIGANLDITERNRHSFALLLLDLDNLKAITTSTTLDKSAFCGA